MFNHFFESDVMLLEPKIEDMQESSSMVTAPIRLTLLPITSFIKLTFRPLF